MLRLFHVADIHFGTLYDQFGPKMRTILRKKKREAFIEMIQRAIDKNIDIMLFSGDIFDKEAIDPSTKIFFQRCMDRLYERGISCYYTKGNHDANHRFSLQHVHILDDNYSLIENHQYRVVGLSYNHMTDKRNITKELKPLPNDRVNLLLFHGLLSSDEHSNYQHLDIKDPLVNQFHYIACGHVHKPINNHDRAFYTGAFFPQNRSDIGDHYYLDVLVDRDDLRIKKVKSTPFTITKKIFELHSTEDDFSTSTYHRLESFIKEHLKENYLHVECHGLLTGPEYQEAKELLSLLTDKYEPYLFLEDDLKIKPQVSKHSFLQVAIEHLEQGLLLEVPEDDPLREDISKKLDIYEKLLLEVFMEDKKWR